MKILMTGGGGFLGTGMSESILAAGHELRIMEPRVCETQAECIVGDVTELEDVRKAVKGMGAIILSHMAPRSPNAYETPEVCFDINVKGTANLFFAAHEVGIKKIVVISTTGIKGPPEDPAKWLATLPLTGSELYQLTKSCQETIAMQYARAHELQVSLLRVGYIVDGEKMLDKYGRVVGERASLDTDRRDVGEVARLCLERDDISLEAFAVMSTRESLTEWGVQHTLDRLGWEPRYDFDRLPLPNEVKS